MARTVGNFIREARETAGVTQHQLVNTINKMFRGNSRISRRHLSNVELGSSGVSLVKLNSITTALVALTTK